MILLKQADVYAPEHLGIKDVLVCGGKIEAVGDNLEGGTGCQVIDAKGMRLTPGLIDRHVHVTGGGGEGSFHTRTPQVELSSILKAGITTVLGLLGTDDMQCGKPVSKGKGIKGRRHYCLCSLRCLWLSAGDLNRKRKEGYCLCRRDHGLKAGAF